MAFHPGYADSGRFFVNYTDLDDDTRIVEYAVSNDPDVADRASGREILTITQPAGNHNGGMIAFGPDGFLWIAMGDGGAANDSFGNGQRADTLLGAMLRIDVGPDAIRPYGIPSDNPFAAGGDGVPEVWAIGLRNPWRFSFDGDDLWIADVGQGEIEEIDRTSVLQPGLNYGWPIYEGSDCLRTTADCTEDGFVFPVHEYGHDEGCSITGGVVYRGAALPELDGHYFFSDFCSGFIRSIAPDGDVFDWTADTGSVDAVTSFGTDVEGEVYVVSGAGTVFRITRGA
jgi:glucose/arabinose dehydrogenase